MHLQTAFSRLLHSTMECFFLDNCSIEVKYCNASFSCSKTLFIIDLNMKFDYEHFCYSLGEQVTAEVRNLYYSSKCCATCTHRWEMNNSFCPNDRKVNTLCKDKIFVYCCVFALAFRLGEISVMLLSQICEVPICFTKKCLILKCFKKTSI